MNLEQKTAVTAPVVSVMSEAFQLTLWPYAIGFVFAFSMLVDMERSSTRMGLWIVARSTLISGSLSQLLSPFMLLALGHYFDWASDWSKTETANICMTALLSIALALTVHKILPRLLQLIGDYRRPENG